MALKVNEVFYSIQGEGPNCGTAATFIRLTGCNLKCSFCDSKYSWSEGKEKTVEEIVEEVKKYPAKLIVITGGEPLLWNLFSLVSAIKLIPTERFEEKYKIEIETNGTLEPKEELILKVDSWVVSPKLSNSGNKKTKLAKYFKDSANINFKFVIENKKDLIEMLTFLKKNKIYCKPIYLMPQCTTAEGHNKILPLLFEFVKQTTWFKISPRLQILAFGNWRGV